MTRTNDMNPDGRLVDSDSTYWSDAHDEPSLVDYARYHGLCKDFLASDPLSSHTLQLLPDFMSLDFDSGNLPELDLKNDACVGEKWSIDPQSALFLQQVLAPKGMAVVEKQTRRTMMRQIKVELPLLSSDAELDQRVFDRKHRTKQSQRPRSNLDSAYWPQENETKLYWPTQDLTDELMQQAKSEKFSLDKDAFVFLQECSSVLDVGEISRPFTPMRKKKQAEIEAARHSSPLLPLSPPFELGFPSSPVCQIPLATSPADPAVNELRRIEETMDPDELVSLDNFSDMSGLEMSEPTAPFVNSPLKRKRIEDMKVEVPLTPAPSSSPTKKPRTVAFSNELCTTIPAYARPFLSDDTENKAYSEFFDSIIQPNTHAAMQQIENEQLMEADSTLRAEVPRIDQTVPLPPWQIFSRKQMDTTTELEAQRKLISMLNREMIKPYEKWSGMAMAKVKNGVTRWRPFDIRLSDLPKEDIEMESLDDYTPSLPEDTTSGWKPDNLRTLDDREDDDEELDCAEIESILEEISLIESGIDWSKVVEIPKSSPVPQTRRPYSNNHQTNLPARVVPNVEAPQIKEAPRMMLGDDFSASNSLDQFMQIHTGKTVFKQTTNEGKPEAIQKKLNPPAPKPMPHDRLGKAAPPQLPMHTPAIPASMPPRFFVLSSTLFEMRVLMRELERLNSTATYIERDFTSNRSLQTGASQALDCAEADIILAPSCGLLLTTLQKVKQKSLPGQVDRNIVRERILRLSRRYERLVVMVSEGQRSLKAGSDTATDTHRMLDDSDCDELVSLINFSAAQSQNVQVLYVPGNETTLATWIISYMARYGTDDPEVRLVPEETFWEVFLRNAGMDVFAAQAILSKLKRPDSMPADLRQQDYGLPAFILMSETSRIKKYSRLLGGDRILRKVSMAIDGHWTGAGRVDPKRLV